MTDHVSADRPKQQNLADRSRDVLQPVWAGETQPMDNGGALRIAIARYRLRAAAHRIAADCERMLDDMDRPERRLWRDAVGEALVASRHLVALLARQPAHGGVPDAGEYFAALFDQIREPQQQIIGSMNTLLGFVPTAPEEELLLQDAKTIRETAVELWAVEDTIVPTAPAPGTPAARTGAPSGETGHRRPRPRSPAARAGGTAPAVAPGRHRRPAAADA